MLYVKLRRVSVPELKNRIMTQESHYDHIRSGCSITTTSTTLTTTTPITDTIESRLTSQIPCPKTVPLHVLSTAITVQSRVVNSH